MLISLLSPRER